MADFTITHRIEAPELTAALLSVADAIKGRAVAVSEVPGTQTPPARETPVQGDTAPTTAPQEATPTNAPVTGAVNGAQSATTDAPAPGPVQNVDTAPVVAATSDPAQVPEKVYTFDEITAAGSQLLEQNKMPQLMELLKGYGVQAVTQLKPEQYASVAVGLRELGARI